MTMSDIANVKKRMGNPSNQAGEMPVWYRGLQKQISQIQQVNVTQVQAHNAQLQWMERIHDRLDTIAVETRVSNLLLSELIALHQTVITEETDETRDAVRNEAYQRVRNAE